MKQWFTRAGIALIAMLAVAGIPSAQAPAAAGPKAPVHAKQVKRLLIKNAMVIPGPAVPAYGPVDILIEDGLISKIDAPPVVGTPMAGDGQRWPEPDEIIDATDKYMMPGIVNTHIHWHEERVGPIPIQ